MIPNTIQVNKSRQVLLICNDVVKPNMTGPAIRYWEFATVLSKYFMVTLAIPPYVQAESSPQALNPTFDVILCKTQADLKALTQTTDVVVTVGANLSYFPFLTRTDKPLVVDMYIPFMLEGLQKYDDRPLHERNRFYEGHRGSHTLQIRTADFILCASEKQKDFWLGWLAALGRVNPYIHQEDPTLSNLIDIVPFGLSNQSPTHDTQVLKGVYKTIGTEDKVILWGGGIWNWLDPHTLIKAMSLLVHSHPQVKLFFMGVKSPNPFSAEMDGATQAIKLSQSLGLFDKTIFFNEWVPYQERHNYLLEADVGISLHLNHIETRFSFRTRLIDYIWAGLPILATEGDVLSEQVANFQLGKIVSGGNVEAVSRGLLELLETPNLRECYKANFDKVRSHYTWEIVTQPLLKFCATPRFAADKNYLSDIPLAESGLSNWWEIPGKILRTVRTQGGGRMIGKVQEYLQ